MRWFLVSATTVVLLACGAPAPPASSLQPQTVSAAPAVEFLIGSAATDFRRQRSPRPVAFRAVRSGYVVTSGGGRQHRLCGEFSPGSRDGEAEWVAFATIETSPYEQWLGGQAVPYCQDAAMTWDSEDLTSRLRSRFDSAR
jgi:hypothetical protein